MDDFDDDSFMADDLFLAEIDNLAAKASAVKRTASAGPTLQQVRPAKFSRPTIGSGKSAAVGLSTAVEAPITARTGAKPAFTLARPAGRTVSSPIAAGAAQVLAEPAAIPSRSVSSSNLYKGDTLPSASEIAKKKAAEARRAAIAAASSSARPAPLDPITGAAQTVAATSNARKLSDAPRSSPSGTLARQSTLSFGPGPTAFNTDLIPNSEAGPSRPRTTSSSALVPSSRLSRTSNTGHASGAGSGGIQIHLNFRRENQTTKGKRWDRTEYAQTGRRIRGKGAKGKDEGKGKRASMGEWSDGEGMDEEEEDEGEPLVPEPKPLVDVSKPYPPPKHPPLPGAIDKYIYPTNRPKRDYQFEIVRACFTDNCLVALPTGLGKTFVAGVVMLNFYRWFPTGKIVFLAPTKPLVNQQIEACQLTCGIPSMDAAVMTGASVSAKERAKLWKERRVFYCTPQTLDNDLKAHRLDPRDIVLAVFDEAHKASGSYAYTTILAFLMAHQPYFRVLALTATPGADVPKVQGVVDALHISRIEIREAEDPNISRYMNEKHTERHVVAVGDKVEEFRDRWAALMKPYIVKLVDKDILNERDLDAKKLKPFRLTHQRMMITQSRDSGQKWAFGPLNSLEKMARAMTHLLEFSLGMFHTTLSEIAGNMTASGKKATSKGNSNALRNNFEFQKLLRDVETEMNLIRIGAQGRTKGDGHPKMTQTMELLLGHFTKADEDEKEHGLTNDTRAMVFCSYRECVLDIVDMLNVHSPVLRATKFVGQSQGKQDRDKGFNQKEQKKTINDFKEGKYNILVSTSIGEEGLDIGEVDFVVIYDMPKQSIKLLQRIGRTGRKRAGQVHVLMSEGREDLNWDKAQDSHREIQEEILHSRNLELFEDVERLLPPGHFPEVEEMEMEVDPWDPENLQEKLAASKAYQKAGAPGKKGEGSVSLTKMLSEEKEQGRSRGKGRGKGKGEGTNGSSGQRGAEIPDDAPRGFKSVAELLREAEERKARKRREAARAQEGFSSDLDFDDLGDVAEYGHERADRENSVSDVPVKRILSPVRRKRRRGASPVRSESEGEEDGTGASDPFAAFGDPSPARNVDESDPSPARGSAKTKKIVKASKAKTAKPKTKRPPKAEAKASAKTTKLKSGGGRNSKGRNGDVPSGSDDDIEVIGAADAADAVAMSDKAADAAAGKEKQTSVGLETASSPHPRLPARALSTEFDDLDDIDMAQFDDVHPSSPSLPPQPQAGKRDLRVDSPSKRAAATSHKLRASEPATAPSSGQALDFFHTSGPIRRGGPSRYAHPPSPPESPSSSPSSDTSPVKPADRRKVPISSPFDLGLPPSPNTDESLELFEREQPVGSSVKGNQESLESNARLSPRTAKMVGFSQIAPVDLNWDMDLDLEDDEDGDLAGELFPQMVAQPAVDKRIKASERAVVDSPTASAPVRRLGLGRPRATQDKRNGGAGEPSDPFRDRSAPGGSGIAISSGPAGSMLPPPVPLRDSRESVLSSPFLPSPIQARSARQALHTDSATATTPTFDATQFPIRKGGMLKRKVIMSSSEAGTPVNERQGNNNVLSSPLAPVRQVARGKKRRAEPPSEPSSPAAPTVRARREVKAAGRGGRKVRARRADVEALMDMTAELSGSASSDESGSDLDRETHSDRIFAGEEFAPTQAPRGYDQRAMYRAGLSTQAGSKAGLGFQPNKRKEAFLAKARKPVYVTDDEGGSGSENDYELGSFVVDDEDELL